jgi:co-chaperonin GroES (HSP10)
MSNREENWPVPSGWRMLIEPLAATTITDSGFMTTNETQVTEKYQNFVGRVVAMGPLCYTHPKFMGCEPWCKVGDYVGYLKHTGESMRIENEEDQKLYAKLDSELQAEARITKEAEGRLRLAAGTSGTEELKKEIADARESMISLVKRMTSLKADYELRIMNDDAILAVIPDHTLLKKYI